MNGLTWLHISDWHQKKGDQDLNRRKVRNAFLEDVKSRTSICADLAIVDFVIFSGDVAFSGLPEEYQNVAKDFLDPLLVVCGDRPDHPLDRNSLFIIPGNHDLDRNALKKLPPRFKKPSGPDKHATWMENKKNRILLLNPFNAFRDFVKGFTGQEHPDYSNIREREIFGKKIAIVGINTAIMSGRNKNIKGEVEDKGSLFISEYQILDKLEQIAHVDIRIAVFHHPIEWLMELDRNNVERQLKERCDFILHGHGHKPEVIDIRSTLGDCVIIPAGASYNRHKAENTSINNAYNFVHLDLETGHGVVYLRRWSDRRSKWVEDIDSYPKGEFKFNIRKLSLNPNNTLVTPQIQLKARDELLNELEEWKDIHTRAQGLLDNLSNVIKFLDKCKTKNISKLRDNLYFVEAEWRTCASSLDAISYMPRDFRYIASEVVVIRCSVHAAKISLISQKIGSVKNSEGITDIYPLIINIKQDFDAALKVADIKIVEIIKQLRNHP